MVGHRAIIGFLLPESIKYAPCLNSVGSSLHACMKETVANLDVASRLPSERRVEGACCHYKKLHGCWRNAAESGCPKEAVEFLQLPDRVKDHPSKDGDRNVFAVYMSHARFRVVPKVYTPFYMPHRAMSFRARFKRLRLLIADAR
ncbi:hypothetical protein MTO96_007543 [Rhipicephalus appendiculatus]